MIFVTVGTHEQPFDRLVQAVDELKEKKIITRDVFIQTGYSTYTPRFCEHAPLIGFDDMLRRMETAEVVITHGGTGSIMLVLYKGKIPLVVPRQSRYNEHIDDHQVHFCKMMETKGKILAAYEMEDLETAVNSHHRRVEAMPHRGEKRAAGGLEERADIFAGKLEKICLDLVK